MEDEIDLRFYANMLRHHWRMIAAVTLLAGVVALTVSSVQPAKYQATALVLITRPLYQFQFSPAIQNLPDNVNAQPALAGKAAVDLANGDALLQQVLLDVGAALPPNERNLFALRKMLKAKTGSDPSIINLSVTNRDPQRVADIANTWATFYVQRVNDLYGKSADQLHSLKHSSPRPRTTWTRQIRRSSNSKNRTTWPCDKRNCLPSKAHSAIIWG